MDKLTDLQICRRIAEIEGINWMPAYPSQPSEFVGLVNDNDSCGTPPELIGEYNPLTDKALCFELMVKHEINVYKITNEVWNAEHRIGKAIKDKNPQRAICLAIIAKHEVNNG